MSRPDRPEALLAVARAEATVLIESLTRRLRGIVESSALDSGDDEHDPEGQTIAYERAQVDGLLRSARAELTELDAAADRLRAGTYGRCERCGGPIAAGRLTARPAARTCIDCAESGRRR